jgi:hypothetical protein
VGTLLTIGLLAHKARLGNLLFGRGNHAGQTIPHIPFGTAEHAWDKRDYIDKANVSFDFAQGTQLIAHIALVEQTTGMPMLDMMSLTCFESEMGRALQKSQKVKADKKYGNETASGVVQILDGVYLYLVEKHLIKQPSQNIIETIERHGGNLGGRLLQSLATIKKDAKKIAANFSRRAALSWMFGHKTPETPQAAPKISTEMVSVLQDNPDIKTQILATRANDLISMLLVARDLMQIHADIDPKLSTQIGGATYRMLHMFGLKGTQDLLNACQNDPSTTMATIFGLTDVPMDDLRWRILDANRIPRAMRADDYIAQSVYDYAVVSNQLGIRYAAYEKVQTLTVESQPLAAAPIPVNVLEKEAKPKNPARHQLQKHHKKLHKPVH